MQQHCQCMLLTVGHHDNLVVGFVKLLLREHTLLQMHIKLSFCSRVALFLCLLGPACRVFGRATREETVSEI